MLKRKILSALLLVITVGAVKAQDANILIGLNGPSYGVKIKNNFPGETRGFARAFMLSNQDASSDFFGFGVNGIVTNGISTPTYGYIGQNYSSPFMTFLPNNNIGIGTLTPQEKLDIKGNIQWNGSNSGNARAVKIGYSGVSYGGIGYNIEFTPSTGIFNRPIADQTSYLEFRQGGFRFYGTSDASLSNNISLAGGGANLNLLASMTSDGKFGLGVTNPTDKMEVNGKIRAQEIKVEMANWPDYVFKKDYELPTLEETENQIKLKGHLPGIPSAAEVKANGIEVGEMNAKLLKKIEELTLHLILKDKELAKERSINKDQEERLSKLESIITERK